MKTTVVRPGDSLWTIARRFRIGLDELLRANPQVKDSGHIHPGQRLYMPAWQAVDSFEPASRGRRARAIEPTMQSVKGPPGAYYRKVTTRASTEYTGMVATGIVPSIHVSTRPQDSRYHRRLEGEPPHADGPMDRPSMYIGGHFGSAKGGTEVDAGLSYQRVVDERGRETYTLRPNTKEALEARHQWIRTPRGYENLATGEVMPAAEAERRGMVPNFAMRPFVRISSQNGHRVPWKSAPTGFGPGERVRISLRIEQGPKDSAMQKLVMVIESLDQPGKKVEMEAPIPAKDAKGPKRFKRVVSIDQFREATAADVSKARRAGQSLREGQRLGNENRAVQPTSASISGAGWTEVYVQTRSGERKPMTNGPNGAGALAVAGADTSSQYGSIFRIGGHTATGGETVSIIPPRP